MKKLFLIFVLALFTVASFAQRPEITNTAASYQLTKVETAYTGQVQLHGSWASVVIQALCTQDGGTSDGQLILQGSVDGTSYINLAPKAQRFLYFPDNDTLTITSGAIQTVVIVGNPFAYYRWKATGTANDTTTVSTTYIFKEN
jgi:hypothetical protein